MQRGEKDSDIRQFQSDGQLVRQPVSDLPALATNEVDTLTLAMRQLMQLPGQTSEQLQQI
jgi:hypothetical protein